MANHFKQSNVNVNCVWIRQAVLGCMVFCLSLCSSQLLGQTTAENSPAPSDPLSASQKQLAEKFARLEDLLLRSAELEAGENPTRAALLQQAVQLSKQAKLNDLLAQAANHLDNKQFSEAISQQKLSVENLQRLLELLQSENREKRVREEREKIKRWIEETDRLLRMQSSLRGRTEGGQNLDQASEDQSRLEQKADEISDDLKSENSPNIPVNESQSNESEQTKSGNEASDTKAPSDSKDSPENVQEKESENSQSESEPKEPSGSTQSPEDAQSQDSKKSSGNDDSKKEPSEGENSEGKPSESPSSDSLPSQGQPSQGQPSQGQPSQGQPSQGQPSDGQQQNDSPKQPETPMERAQQKIERAQKRMQEAQEALEKAEREGAIEKQREAEKELRDAIEDLEEILRQLREEEIERSLASLESRLRKMLELQKKVATETERLQEIAGENPSRQIQIQASNLAKEERTILSEGERAQLLLREEGSSAAFPEALKQVNSDVAKVADRLNQGDIGVLTLSIQEEIVLSLEEMIESLVQIQKENEKKKQQQDGQQQQQQGAPGEQPLVDKLAEIRLIRTLQLRVNKRTESLSKMLADPADPVGQAKEGEIIGELRSLAERQASIQQVTRDIVTGQSE